MYAMAIAWHENEAKRLKNVIIKSRQVKQRIMFHENTIYHLKNLISLGKNSLEKEISKRDDMIKSASRVVDHLTFINDQTTAENKRLSKILANHGIDPSAQKKENGTHQSNDLFGQRHPAFSQ